MARIRQIKPDFYLDDELALCPRDARLMFPGLWILADRAGRLEDRPARIKAQLFPYDDDITVETIEHLLGQLWDHDFIIRYAVEDRRYIQIRTFEKHQHCHIKEPPSQLPAPPKLKSTPGVNPVPEPDKYGASTVPESVEHRSSTSASGVLSMDNGILRVGVGNGDGGLGERAKPAVSKNTPALPAADFILTDELREWAHELAPTIDLEAEAEKFRNYYGRDGTNFSDLPKAWRNWITRAVEFEKRARSPGPSYRESIPERNARVFAEVEAEDAAKAKQAEQQGRS